MLGDRREDLVAHAASLRSQFEALHQYVEDISGRLDQRMTTAEQRLDGAIAYTSLVRYDAYGEMSGHQSMSIALLDSTRSGVVLSAILHRDQARLYAKQVHGGRGELELSPEEDEAIKLALQGRGGQGGRRRTAAVRRHCLHRRALIGADAGRLLRSRGDPHPGGAAGRHRSAWSSTPSRWPRSTTR